MLLFNQKFIPCFFCNFLFCFVGIAGIFHFCHDRVGPVGRNLKSFVGGVYLFDHVVVFHNKIPPEVSPLFHHFVCHGV